MRGQRGGQSGRSRNSAGPLSAGEKIFIPGYGSFDIDDDDDASSRNTPESPTNSRNTPEIPTNSRNTPETPTNQLLAEQHSTEQPLTEQPPTEQPPTEKDVDHEMTDLEMGQFVNFSANGV